MKKPRLRQFTIATMLCVVVVVAIPLAIYAHWMQEIQSEEAAITKLVELGYFVSCSDIPKIPRPRPYPPSWFVARFAPGFQHATRVIGNPGRSHHGIGVEPNRPYVRGADVPEFFLGDPYPYRKFDSGLQELGRLRQLQYVRISHFTANLNDIAGMGQCIHLNQLLLVTESSFPSELMQAIATSCPNLEQLHIAQQIPSSFSDADVRQLSRLSKLTTLRMYGLNVTASAIASLPNTLEDLSLANFTPLDVDGSYAIAFSKFVNLKYLHLASTSLGDAAFIGVKLPHLEILTIWECPKVTTQTTESVMQLPSLLTLFVSSDQISPQQLDSLNGRDRKLDVHINSTQH